MQQIVARIAALLALCVLTSCGGNGNSEQPIQQTDPLPVPVQPFSNPALYGDWPLQSPTAAFLVSNQQEWETVWKERQAFLAPRCRRPEFPGNAAACGSAAPPDVDFSRYSLLGLLHGSMLYFSDPTPRRVTLNGSSDTLTVEYQYATVVRVPAILEMGARFFLVPQTDAKLDPRPRSECDTEGAERPFVAIKAASVQPRRVMAPSPDSPSTFVVRWSADSSTMGCLDARLTASQPDIRQGRSTVRLQSCDGTGFEETCSVSHVDGEPQTRWVSCTPWNGDGFRAQVGAVQMDMDVFYDPKPGFIACTTRDSRSLTVTLE